MNNAPWSAFSPRLGSKSLQLNERSLRARCASLITAAAVIALVLMAILDERPLVMLVGLAPLILIAGEAVWHILAGLERSGD